MATKVRKHSQIPAVLYKSLTENCVPFTSAITQPIGFFKVCYGEKCHRGDENREL